MAQQDTATNNNKARLGSQQSKCKQWTIFYEKHLKRCMQKKSWAGSSPRIKSVRIVEVEWIRAAAITVVFEMHSETQVKMLFSKGIDWPSSILGSTCWRRIQYVAHQSKLHILLLSLLLLILLKNYEQLFKTRFNWRKLKTYLQKVEVYSIHNTETKC